MSDPENLAALVRSILPASTVARLDFEHLTVLADRCVDEGCNRPGRDSAER